MRQTVPWGLKRETDSLTVQLLAEISFQWTDKELWNLLNHNHLKPDQTDHRVQLRRASSDGVKCRRDNMWKWGVSPQNISSLSGKHLAVLPSQTLRKPLSARKFASMRSSRKSHLCKVKLRHTTGGRRRGSLCESYKTAANLQTWSWNKDSLQKKNLWGVSSYKDHSDLRWSVSLVSHRTFNL